MSKILFRAKARASVAQQERNRVYSRRLALSSLGQGWPVAANLAVVGGGLSLRDALPVLAAWDGDIWGINDTATWLSHNGIDAALYTVDPLLPGEFAGVDRAILGDCVPSALFDAFLARGVPVELARLGTGDDEIRSFSTSAATAPVIASRRGHAHVRFFGCDSSWGASSHVYKNITHDGPRVWVECGGQEFVTNPQMLMQAEDLSALVRGVPEFLSVAPGGFLPALVEHGDYAVTHVSRDLHEALERAREKAKTCAA